MRRPPRSTLDRSSAASDVYKRQALTFCPRRVTSSTPCCARLATSLSTSSKGRETSSPRVYGTTQKEQYLLQPSMIETNADAPSTLAGGMASNFSISGKLMSTCARPDSRRLAMRAGRRCRAVSYTHLRAHETVLDLVCRLLLEKTILINYNLYISTTCGNQYLSHLLTIATD